MAEDAPIVRDTRKVRHSISEKFGHDVDRYIAYLQKRAVPKPGSQPVVGQARD
jgi:hypothetical protein